MKKIASILKNKEIMNRILFTILILFVFRIGAQITVPGVSIDNSSELGKFLNGNNPLSLMNLMGGGTLQSFSIFALGVSPYITSQIIVQLLSTDVLPALSELKRQGQYGRKKMEMATRYLTLMLGAVQAYGIIKTMQNSQYINFTTASNEIFTYIYIVIVLLAGSMLVMWLGDQISVKGIGNGISMIIFAGIVSGLPTQMTTAFMNYCGPNVMAQGDVKAITGVFQFLLYVFAYLLIISFVTFTELAKRKIPVQHSGKGGQTQSMAKASFLPIKINSASVIPVIFASSILMTPSIIVAFVDPDNASAGWLQIFNMSTLYEMPGGWYMPWGLIIYLVLTIAFTFFYANLQINPQQLAENFQKNGSYIPGIRPGNETERYIRKVLNRVTCIGALALAFIAALPPVLTMSGIFGANGQALALGGTGLIIVVGVALELNSQIDGLLAGKSFDEVVAGGGQ